MKCVEDINSIAKLSDINYSPFAQYVDTDFLDADSHALHRFPIARVESILYRAEFESRGAAGLVGKITQVIETRPHEF